MPLARPQVLHRLVEQAAAEAAAATARHHEELPHEDPAAVVGVGSPHDLGNRFAVLGLRESRPIPVLLQPGPHPLDVLRRRPDRRAFVAGELRVERGADLGVGDGAPTPRRQGVRRRRHRPILSETRGQHVVMVRLAPWGA